MDWKCSRCDGSGTEQAPEWSESVLRMMRGQQRALEDASMREIGGGGVTVQEVAEYFGWPYQTTVKRMEALKANGKVLRRREGRQNLWRLA